MAFPLSFNSLNFFFYFLPVVYALFWTFKSKSQRYLLLILSSYIFYASYSFKFLGLLILSTSIAYLSGLALLHFENKTARFFSVAVPIIIDLGILCLFKYYNFFLDNLAQALAWWNLEPAMPFLDIVVPVGMSFYVFHTISYMIDAYRRVITPTGNFLEFAAYVSLFPQLACGPIIRYWQIDEDLKKIDQAKRMENNNIAWSFITIGLIEKVLIADQIGLIIEPALKHYNDLSTVGAWMCMVGFAYRYLFDFAGYCDMAVGIGYLLGLHIPQNFNSPFKALDIGDFARRWHISLYMCMRDLVYLPLVGTRPSVIRVVMSVFITVILIGLWHGAKWTFILWALYVASLIVLHYLVRPFWQKLPASLRIFLTFIEFVIGLTLFAAQDMTMAKTLLTTMFSCKQNTLMQGWQPFCVLLLVSGYLAHIAPNSFEIKHDWKPGMVIVLGILFLLCLFLLAAGQQFQFLYFQF